MHLPTSCAVHLSYRYLIRCATLQSHSIRAVRVPYDKHCRQPYHHSAREIQISPHHQPTKWWEEATLYVHWPYCQRRCTYCNFNKYIEPNVDHEKMQQCLVQEARTLIAGSGVKRIRSVFFGGGTPSLAKPQTLQAILEAVSGMVMVPYDAEISMEGNPTSVGLAKLREFKQAGTINRYLYVIVSPLPDLCNTHFLDPMRPCTPPLMGYILHHPPDNLE